MTEVLSLKTNAILVNRLKLNTAQLSTASVVVVLRHLGRVPLITNHKCTQCSKYRYLKAEGKGNSFIVFFHASMLSRLFTPWHGATTAAQPAHVDPTLDSCTRYPSLLGGQRQCRMRSLPKAPTHDQCRKSNPRPLDLWSSALPTGQRDPI